MALLMLDIGDDDGLCAVNDELMRLGDGDGSCTVSGELVAHVACVTTQTYTSEFRAWLACEYQVYLNIKTNQPKLKVLIKNYFLYSCLYLA